MSAIPTFDVVVVGAGVAGLQATLTLARARRRVLLLDGGPQRHAVSSHMHNMIGADGMERTAFFDAAHATIAQYEEAYHVAGEAVSVVPTEDAFVLTLAGGEEVMCAAVLLTTGLHDVLPEVAGMQALWGTRVLHCAYCHGYEVGGRAIGLYAKPAYVFDLLEANLNLSPDITVFFDDEATDARLVEQAEALGVRVVTTPIAQVTQTADGVGVVLTDGTTCEVAALFVKPVQVQRSSLPQAMGCSINERGFIAADGWGRTSVPWVYAAGDAAGAYAQLASSVAAGLHAAVIINADFNALRIRQVRA
ncbi:MAG: thioredoxin reductase [Alphaproteobacteria bacterium]|nr:thioredoxin reductase [Alphaproteobacteria bacterium]